MSVNYLNTTVLFDKSVESFKTKACWPLGHYKHVFLLFFSSTIGAIVDLHLDGLIHYSSEDCISGNTRMIMTFYLEEFEKSDWADINLEEIKSFR